MRGKGVKEPRISFDGSESTKVADNVSGSATLPNDGDVTHNEDAQGSGAPGLTLPLCLAHQSSDDDKDLFSSDGLS